MDLPNELLLHVFSFLPLHSRKVASLVCKRWRDVAQSVRLTSEDVFVITDFPNVGSNSVLPDFGTVINLRVMLKRSSEWCGKQQRQFWVDYGADVKSLCIESLEDDACLFPIEVYEHCPNLQTLKVKIYSLSMHRCHLKLFSEPSFPSKILHFEVNSSCPFLLRLVHEHAPKIRRVLFNAASSELFEMWAHQLLEFIKKKGWQLKELKFSATNVHINEGYFNEMLGSLGPQLTKLNICGSTMLNDDGLSLIAGNLPNLKDIAFDLNSWVSEAGLENLFSSLWKLTHINVTRKTGRCNIMKAMTIGVLPYLQSLYLYCFPANKVFHKAFVTFFELRRQITDIRIEDIKGLSDDILIKALRNVPSLRCLGLHSMKHLTVNSLKEIFRVARHLESVAVTGCNKINCHLPELNGLTSLRHLALLFENEDLLLDLKLPVLRILAVHKKFFQETNQPNVDPSCRPSLLRLFKNCPSLEYVLDMSSLAYFRWHSCHFYAINRQLECVLVRAWEEEVMRGSIWNTPPVFTMH